MTVSKLLRPLALTGLSFALAGALSMTGCGDSGTSTDETDPPDECEGGVIVDGVCEGKCTGCIENNVCVHNRCRLQCETNDECHGVPATPDDPPLQGCVAVPSDSETGIDDGSTVNVCLDAQKATKVLEPCPNGDECDDPNDPNDWACPDGSPCVQGEGSELCSPAECRALICRSNGFEGDADAYCTTVDCTEDAHCGPGMYCTVDRFPNKICGTDKGETDPCIDAATFNADAATYQEGPISLLRNICKKREPCAPCVTQADCSIRSDLSCVNLNGQNVCSKSCNVDDECPNDFYCEQTFCIPRTGNCVPPTTNNFCHSCLNDLQCGTKDTTLACIETQPDQHACFDVSFPDECAAGGDADCPESPSGKHGECLDDPNTEASPADPVFNHCYLPWIASSGSYECWPD